MGDVDATHDTSPIVKDWGSREDVDELKTPGAWRNAVHFDQYVSSPRAIKPAILATLIPCLFILLLYVSPLRVPFVAIFVWPIAILFMCPVGGVACMETGRGIFALVWVAVCLVIGVAYVVGSNSVLALVCPLLIVALFVTGRRRARDIALLAAVLGIHILSATPTLWGILAPVFDNPVVSVLNYFVDPYVVLVYCLWLFVLAPRRTATGSVAVRRV